MTKLSLLDRLEQFFREHEGRWVDGRRLESVAGCYAWRSRVAECRTQRGMDIQNRQRRVRGAIGMMTISEYQFVSEVVSPPAWGCSCVAMAEPPCGWCDGPDREVRP